MLLPSSVDIFSSLFPLQVFKEEEEAIKVDVHEGCGRVKLFWLMALADPKALRAMVEFRYVQSECVRCLALPEN